MLQIRKEVDDIISGKQPKDSNLLKNAPHPVALMTLPESEWNRPYTKDQAAYPLPNLRKNKFWPTVTRIDDGTSQTLDDRYIVLTPCPTAYGDTHLICSCDSVEDYAGTDDAELKISGGVQSNT